MTVRIPGGAPFGSSPAVPVTKGEQIPGQITADETFSRNIVGSVEFDLYNLQVVASVAEPTFPDQVAPSNKAQIVENGEKFSLKTKIRFNNTPLSRLLLCLGIDVKINFCIEGCGGNATEVDVVSSITTVKDEFEYEIVWTGTADEAGMTPGFYGVAAVANIEMSDNPCAPCLLGAGYIAGILMQVYDA